MVALRNDVSDERPPCGAAYGAEFQDTGYSLHPKSYDKQDRKEEINTKQEELRTDRLMHQLEARLYGTRTAPLPHCPCCGTALSDGTRQYFAPDGSCVGCESCVTIRWH